MRTRFAQKNLVADLVDLLLRGRALHCDCDASVVSLSLKKMWLPSRFIVMMDSLAPYFEARGG